MLSKIFVGGMSSLVFLAVGCTTVPYQPYARDVKKAPGKSGIIALHTNPRSEDRTEADRKMKDNCKGQEVNILEEGEVTVGQQTDSQSAKTRGTKDKEDFAIGGLSFGEKKPSEDTETSSVTTALKEWQISYNCIAKAETAAPEKVEAVAEPIKTAPAKAKATSKKSTVGTKNPAANSKKK